MPVISRIGVGHGIIGTDRNRPVDWIMGFLGDLGILSEETGMRQELTVQGEGSETNQC